MTAPRIPDDAIIPARAEGLLARRWAEKAQAERERFAKKWQLTSKQRPLEVSKAAGRAGAAVALEMRRGETPTEKAANRAMFVARHHPPLTTRALIDRYGVSDTYARRTCALLLKQKRIRLIGKAPNGAKLYEAVE